jgi:hypothetical protein
MHFFGEIPVSMQQLRHVCNYTNILQIKSSRSRCTFFHSRGGGCGGDGATYFTG